MHDVHSHRHVRDGRRGQRTRFGDIGTYDEMMREYMRFSLCVPPVVAGGTSYRFSGQPGEEAYYQNLRQQGAVLVYAALRTATLTHAMRDLASGKYSMERRHQMPQVQVTYIIMLDGEGLLVSVDPADGAFTVSTQGSWVFPGMSMSVVCPSRNLDEVKQRFSILLRDHGQLEQHPTESEMDALYAAASNRHVVYVDYITVRDPAWSERPLRLIHAIVALLAKLGAISGSSLVVIDRRSYVVDNAQRMPRALEEGVRASRYNFDPIGSGNLMAARADYMHPQVGDYHSVRHAQIRGRSKRSAFGAGACLICLETEPPPTQRGCACRGDAGLAHVACLAKQAESAARRGKVASWFTCDICNQKLTGAVRKHLALEWTRKAQSPAHRLMAEFNLSLCSKESLDWSSALTAQTRVLASLDQIVPSDVADSLFLSPADLDAVSRAGFVDTDEFYQFRVQLTQELASSLGQTGQTAEAIRRLRTLLAWCRRAIGQSAESTLAVANELAAMLLDEGHAQESVDVLELVVDGLVSKHGARHKSTLIAKGNLATALSKLGTRDSKRKSADMMREILHVGESTFGKHHPFTLTALANLASTLFDLGEYSESEKLYREASVLGKDNDPRFHLNVRGIARALEAQGKVDESRALARRELSTQDAIPANTTVVLQSLRAQTELNGRMGTVISHDPTKARYTVRVAGKDVSVKRECLRRAVCYNPACSAPATSKCGRCESVFYCSQACQRTHWRAHKPACVAI